MRGGLGTSEPSREGTDMKWCLSRAFLTHRWSRGTRGACVTSGTQSTLKKKWTQHRGTWLPATGPGFCPGSTLGAAPPPPIPIPRQHSPASLWSPSGPRVPAGKRREERGTGQIHSDPMAAAPDPLPEAWAPPYPSHPTGG